MEAEGYNAFLTDVKVRDSLRPPPRAQELIDKQIASLQKPNLGMHTPFHFMDVNSVHHGNMTITPSGQYIMTDHPVGKFYGKPLIEDRPHVYIDPKVSDLTEDGCKFYLDGEDVTSEVVSFNTDAINGSWKLFLRVPDDVVDVPKGFEEVHGDVLVLDSEGEVVYDYFC